MKKQSVILDAAINRLRGLAEVNHEVMDADDYSELQATISDLVKMKHEALAMEYRHQIESFVVYLQNSVTVTDGDEWNEWCQTPYIISHGDRKVTIDNGSEVYEGLIELLTTHLNEID